MNALVPTHASVFHFFIFSLLKFNPGEKTLKKKEENFEVGEKYASLSCFVVELLCLAKGMWTNLFSFPAKGALTLNTSYSYLKGMQKRTKDA